jgi:hypothetical protein
MAAVIILIVLGTSIWVAFDAASKADELTKLDALRQSGALTQEEFDAEKVKLLS